MRLRTLYWITLSATALVLLVDALPVILLLIDTLRDKLGDKLK